MNLDQLQLLVINNLGTLVFAFFGSLILTALSIKEHIDRDEKDKMGKGKYSIYVFGWVVGYPILGVVITLAYLDSGNQFGNWLALQIGLTSPAILAGIASGGANVLSKKGVETAPGQ
ncbi:hypothetical protein O1B75_003550 [Vibrio cholerae]|uniref:hypothetical protein n=1 Tax=Vibrio cholerae TaxID=666 RepID=UPI000D3826B6|nr:hypothetical protein [Vibrio cholerae]AWB72162.1 hypothetical protein Sa5Y_VCA03060 [Vibrio cholerae]EJK2417434.1 hypothetical protein [Vibrio cholerae]EJL7013006.1 hypothetical protein [Vibrio cholerae]EKF9252519.1 hypothetical protein [Vibrio cholerae]EKF9270347.1 hypothetical protein [Vibrio cholerae]